jgi:hypothetical protein
MGKELKSVLKRAMVTYPLFYDIDKMVLGMYHMYYKE